jgi:hypothetical protein
MRFESRRRRGVSSIVGSIFFILIMIVAIASLVTIFNSFTGYNQQVNKASGANSQAEHTSLSITSNQFGPFPPSTTSNFNVATGPLPSLALDGTPCSNTVTGTSIGCSLTTTGTSDVIIVNAVTSSSGITVSSVCTASPCVNGLAFTHRVSVSQSASDNEEEWYATTTSTFSGTITVTWSASGTSLMSAFAVSGASTTSPFDPNLSSPVTATNTGTNPSVTVTTTNANDFVFSLSGNDRSTSGTTCRTYTAGGSFTLFFSTTPTLVLGTTDCYAENGEYQIVSSTQSSVAISFTLSSTSANWEEIGDAIQQSKVGSGCSPTTSTFPTNRAKVFSASNMWWDFFTCNSAFQYSSSFDGVTWQAPTTIPSVITAGYTVGPYFDIEVSGSTFYLAIAEKGASNFQYGTGTLNQGGTNSAPAGVIAWSQAPANLATTANALGAINMAVDAAGNEWVAVVEGTCTTTSNCGYGLYEHEACATGASVGWENSVSATCGNSNAPGNYAPAAIKDNNLGLNAHSMFFPIPSTLGSTGVIFMYESSATTSQNTAGTLTVLTTTTLASSSWTTITPSVGTYSLTSSSADMMGTTMYFAGLAASAGTSSGNLKFWTLAFSSMTSATSSTETTIEGGANYAWQAALTVSGTTLVLFDNPSSGTDTCTSGTCLQFYTSSTLGTPPVGGQGGWSSAILLVSGESAVSNLCPGDGAFAVTWTNSANYVRFAALSSLVVSNGSPFGVHLVDLYVYNSGTNSLVAHWYLNSTEDFDYWVGQGNTMTIPVRFVWTASTAYLFTVSTDTGVTATLSATSPPANTACPSGSFLSQVSPTTVCSGTTPTTPYTISGAGANTCADSSSSAQMMGLGMSYATRASSSGSLYVSFAFEVASPTTAAGLTSAWRLYYGTGTPIGCNGGAAPAGSVAIGQPITVASQTTTAKQLSQSVSTTLSGLSPGTTYWFDIQATDSSAAASWTYSNPDMAITDVQTSGSPNLTTSTNTNTCGDSSGATAKMMGFATTFTTGGAGFTGNVFGKLTFNIASGATTTSGATTKYTVYYGTGTAPGCTTTLSGTLAGNQFTVGSQSTTVATGEGAKAGFVLTGLAASTTYWVDVRVVDSSSSDTWTYSNPTLAVMEMPTATNSLPSVAGSPVSAITCTDSTAAIYFMAGFGAGATGTKYTIPVSAVGDLYITLTFQVTIPATSGATVQWQVAYSNGAPPACGVYWTGTTKGNTYVVSSQAALAGAVPQSETFVIQNVENLAGTTLWVDVQTLTTSGSWVFSNPEISVVMFPG